MFQIKSSLFKLKMSLDLKLKEIEKHRESLKEKYLFVYPLCQESEEDFIVRDYTYNKLWCEADGLARLFNRMI